MHHSAGVLRGAQHHVVVLTSVELRTEPADFLQEVTFHDQQMTEIREGEQEIGCPIGLEVRIELTVLLVDLVVVTVENVRIGMNL